jgi:DNA invertase Pin-like site-specific DNA recombinase
LIKERQREGIAAAKARGQKLGAPSKLKPDQVKELKARAQAGENKTKLAAEYGISRVTLYSILALN